MLDLKRAILFVCLLAGVRSWATKDSCDAVLLSQHLKSAYRHTQHGSDAIAEMRDDRPGHEKDIYYIFNLREGGQKIYKQISATESKPISRAPSTAIYAPQTSEWTYQIVLGAVNSKGEVSDKDQITVTVASKRSTSQTKSFFIERWDYMRGGESRGAAFYNAEEEQHFLDEVKKLTEVERKKINADPLYMSPEDRIRHEITEEIRARGADPGQQEWFEDEVKKRLAQMFHDMTR